MKLNVISASMAIAMLSTCGGSEDGFYLFGAQPSSGFDDLVTQSEIYNDHFSGANEVNHTVSNIAVVPTSGTASFSGYMEVGPSRLSPASFTQFKAGAETTVTVNFDEGTAAGESGQFYDVSDPYGISGEFAYGAKVDGSVSYSLSGDTNLSNSFLGEATGTLTATNGGEIVVNEAIFGAVMGPNGEAFRAATISELGVNVQVYTLED
ncbi:MAG: hypothetical protein AAFP98_00725 [Pseudomonadota bacterium]